MHQSAEEVGKFARDCCRRRWASPPEELFWADAVSAEEAEAVMGLVLEEQEVVEVQELSDQFFSALSEEFHDVYSDAYYDALSVGTP